MINQGQQTQVERKSQIVEVMDELDETVQMLIERLASFECRLSAVVKPVPASNAPATSEPKQSMVPLAERIRNNRQRLHDTYLAVGDLLNRLEL